MIMENAGAVLTEALGWALLHFVWQGFTIGVGLAAALAVTRRAGPRVRYAASCLAMGLLAALPLLTVARQVLDLRRIHASGLALRTEGRRGGHGDSVGAGSGIRTGGVPAAPGTLEPDRTNLVPPDPGPGSARRMRIAPRIRPLLPWVVLAWAAGVALLSLRLVASWSLVARWKRRAVAPAGPRVSEALRRLAHRLGVRRRVRALCSGTVSVPTVVGWLRPVILLPAATLAGLRLEHLEAVLAHELAHVRRCDYLVNLIQGVVETVLFYHPVVWWVSAQMRLEREQCCDDVASRACGGALPYARALTALETMRDAAPTPAVAATGGSLLQRIKRLTGPRSPSMCRAASAVSLVVVLALAAAAAPLAVLRATAGPPHAPAGGMSDDKAVASEETSTGAEGIAITVVDAASQEPIPEFRVIAGIRRRTPRPRTGPEASGRDGVAWQPHTLRTGRDGKVLWSWDRAYPEMALRVEAAGYVPQQRLWIEKTTGKTPILFELVEDVGVERRVLRPDGEPAGGASVALALPGQRVVMAGGRILGVQAPPPEGASGNWRRPVVVQSDGRGRFRLPTEIDRSAAVFVVHESGASELTFQGLLGRPEVRLRAWGRIEGRLLWHDVPGSREVITLSLWRDTPPGVLTGSERTRTDAEGRFVFEKILPGRAQISRPIELPAPGRSGTTHAILDGLFRHVEVASGKPTPVLLGGQGRPVTGRLTGRRSWEAVTIRFHPEAPHIGFPGDDAQWKAFGIFRESAVGPLFFREGLGVSVDGVFRLDHVLPGRYQLFVSAPGVENHAAFLVMSVPAETVGEEPDPLDLGEIPVRSASPGAESGRKPAGEEPGPEPSKAEDARSSDAFDGKIDESAVEATLRSLYERNLERAGEASARIGRVKGWVLAYDHQYALRRMAGKRLAKLRILEGGRVLAHPRRASLPVVEGELGTEALTGLLSSLARDPETRELPLEEPLDRMPREARDEALTGALVRSLRPAWDRGGLVVLFRQDGSLYRRELKPGVEDPVLERLEKLIATVTSHKQD